ncbi:hypothetical protein [Simiduia agarivorans]|uniref:Uncharacterized protein n=1 Tax=Simiduia agarivorans (strain DSM 21679 / JCM 13881 / BCRC 17597 / SA1) TaxID=1117647 RepID=K4KXA2_SIMAS|nr:hypothetical protein [Simiduia agarivorans]AFU98567.1 hypothetical protein M5M_06860 [Simiduia agarivorans SA1 = DSM 21679]
MLVWDLSPGYLNNEELRQQLAHIAALLAARGQSDDPEVSRRWGRCLNALRCLEAWMQAEWDLRGLGPLEQGQRTHLAPLNLVWPSLPDVVTRFQHLGSERDSGRIALPRTIQGLWSHYKYSVAARSMEAYRAISVKVTAGRGNDAFAQVAQDILLVMRQRPELEPLRDALLQMWGYVSAEGQLPGRTYQNLPALFQEIQRRAQKQQNAYLLNSTALSELSVWLENPA